MGSNTDTTIISERGASYEDHRGRGGHRELLFSLYSLWFFEPIPGDAKKSLDVTGTDMFRGVFP